ncbi:hypothetical protein G7046_g2478 [Stylonectria norvegica]|nr:hypothetical protein G7046_g2478 [Stylonectria norvegica]
MTYQTNISLILELYNAKLFFSSLTCFTLNCESQRDQSRLEPSSDSLELHNAHLTFGSLDCFTLNYELQRDTMSSMEPSSTRVPLQTVKDWERWDQEFQTKAISLHLWESIDPESEGSPMKRPQRPEVGSYHRRTPPRNKDTEHLLHPGRQIRQVEQTDSNHRARNISELTAEDKASLSFEWRVYEQSYREYEVQESSCDKLKQWVAETVDYDLRRSSCPPMQDLRTWYKNLKTRVGTSTREEERAARQNYEEATTILTRASSDFAGWITRWENATNQALMRKTRGVEDPNTWFDDLTKATRLVWGNWDTIYAGVYRDKLDKKTLTIREVADNLRREILKQEEL